MAMVYIPFSLGRQNGISSGTDIKAILILLALQEVGWILLDSYVLLALEFCKSSPKELPKKLNLRFHAMCTDNGTAAHDRQRTRIAHAQSARSQA